MKPEHVKKMAASYVIASMIPDNRLSPSYVIPNALDKQVSKVIAEAVAIIALEKEKISLKTS
jgi:malate dehydrogenase (oxaloacetate-decarboxylating)